MIRYEKKEEGLILQQKEQCCYYPPKKTPRSVLQQTAFLTQQLSLLRLFHAFSLSPEKWSNELPFFLSPHRKFATSSHVQSLYLIILSRCITCLSITSFHLITGTCQYPQPIYRDRLWTPTRHLSLYPSSHLKQYGAFAQRGYFNLFVSLCFVLACTVPRIGPH